MKKENRGKNQSDNIIKDHKFWRKVIIIFSLFIFPLIIPPFLEKGIFSGHDIFAHLIYLQIFTQALGEGQFPVRWTEWISPGLNQPLFNFYQPMFYYVFQIPKFLGASFFGALNLTVISLWFLSGLFMFLFAKRHFGALGGILASVFYVFAPYHIEDIFVRAALPEFTALTFAPAIFWIIKAFKDTNKSFYLALNSIFVALLILSHPPTFIMFFLLIFIYIFFLFKDMKSAKFLFYAFLSIFWGLGMASFFILPVFFEQKDIQSIFLKTGYYDFHSHFVCFSELFWSDWNYGASVKGCLDGMSFQLGIAHWAVVLITVYFMFKNFVKLNLKPRAQNSAFGIRILFLIFLSFSLYLTFSVSQPIWEAIPYLSYVQFPWRFLSVAVFTASFLAGGVLLSFKKESYRYAVYLGLIFLVFIAYVRYLRPAQYFNEEQTALEKEKILPELGYMPKWTRVSPDKNDIPKDNIRMKGLANIKIIKSASSKKEYKISAQETTHFLFYVNYFPGWKVFLDGAEVKPKYDNALGFMEVKTLPGEHNIILSFEDTPVRKWGNILSVLFLFFLFLFLFWKHQDFKNWNQNPQG